MITAKYGFSAQHDKVSAYNVSMSEEDFLLTAPAKWILSFLVFTFVVDAAVTAGFLARVSNHLAAETACFRMRITLGVVLIRSLVCIKCVPGRLRSISGVALE